MSKYNREAGQAHKKYSGSRDHGRATVYIVCPFCKVEVTAYIWSLAGGGKKCDCGAIHINNGMTYPVLKKV